MTDQPEPPILPIPSDDTLVVAFGLPILETIYLRKYGVSLPADKVVEALTTNWEKLQPGLIQLRVILDPLLDELQERRRRELVDLMSEVSEDFWVASWLNGLEFSLWGIVFEGNPTNFGMGSIPPETVSRLRALAEATDTWWSWGDNDSGRRTHSLADFKLLYDKYVGKSDGG